MQTSNAELRALECAVISPLGSLYTTSQSLDVRVGSLKILLHVLEVIFLSHQILWTCSVTSPLLCLMLTMICFLNCHIQRHGEKLHHSWPDILEMLRWTIFNIFFSFFNKNLLSFLFILLYNSSLFFLKICCRGSREGSNHSRLPGLEDLTQDFPPCA